MYAVPRVRRSWLICGLAICISLLLAACGGDDGDSGGNTGDSKVNASNWTLKSAAAPYKGTEIRVLDEVTGLQPAMKELIPDFEKETGIKVSFELEPHPDVIRKGEADLISGRGAYDAVMIHVAQKGRVLAADAVQFIDDYYDNEALRDPDVKFEDFIQPLTDNATKFGDNRLGFPNWNYNVVWWGRQDLMDDPGEQAAFKKEFGRDLEVPKTLQEVRDFAKFFTRSKGEKLAGKTVERDFPGFVMEGSQLSAATETLDPIYLRQFGGGLWDEDGKPAATSPGNVEAMKLWAEMWKYGPAGQAEMSLIDIPVVMGEGGAASGWIWSDFIFPIDVEGGSQYAGKFVYGGAQPNGEDPETRSTSAQPGTLVIGAGSKNKEATYLFLQWMASKETQDRWVESGAFMPVRKDTLESPAVTDGPRANLYAAVKESLAHGTPWPAGLKLYELFDAVNRMQQAVGQGKASPEDGLASLQSDMEEICGDSCLLPQE
ncbi:MAG: multiple sugar transport system substrate-binding protein [Thermoleophilaceae bacterium]|jgi:multiple sugar transport system substrate-binding protein|nr:multiple sugar transport system substrate-binding protein [Thermoleophilaceae bacterium]